MKARKAVRFSQKNSGKNGKGTGSSPPEETGGEAFPQNYRPGSQLVARRSSQVCRRTMSPERPSFTRATAGMGLEL